MRYLDPENLEPKWRRGSKCTSGHIFYTSSYIITVIATWLHAALHLQSTNKSKTKRRSSLCVKSAVLVALTYIPKQLLVIKCAEIVIQQKPFNYWDNKSLEKAFLPSQLTLTSYKAARDSNPPTTSSIHRKLCTTYMPTKCLMSAHHYSKARVWRVNIIITTSIKRSKHKSTTLRPIRTTASQGTHSAALYFFG